MIVLHFLTLDSFLHTLSIKTSYGFYQTVIKVLKPTEDSGDKRPAQSSPSMSLKKQKSTRDKSSIKKPKGYVSAFNFFLSERRKEFQLNEHRNVSIVYSQDTHIYIS